VFLGYTFPNPFEDELNVVIENVQDNEFELYFFDDLGRLVYTKQN
jgi:hypothetical protein